MKNDYYHWYFGDNILREDEPSYLSNWEIGISIRFNYADSYFASFEEFYASIADVQFLSGMRPDDKEVERILIEGWNFLCEYEEEEENRVG